METFRRKHELLFALVFIALYVIGNSLVIAFCSTIGPKSCIALAVNALISLILFLFIRKEHLQEYYGLCAPKLAASAFLWYIPLIIIATVNIWFGVNLDESLTPADIACFVLNMLAVGFLEELLLRGLLFNAVRKKSVKNAVLISTLTFGIGHAVNLVNGSGMSIAAVICQVFYAFAVGFLFVMLFFKGKSLLPCIVTHGVLNALSLFTTETAERFLVPVSLVLMVIALVYAVIVVKRASSVKE